MSRKIKTIPITIEDVSFIFNDKMDEFYFITQNCFCPQCKNSYRSTITNYKILLNDLFDIELEGNCLECGHRVGRYIETGENLKTASSAESIWKTNKTLKELKMKKKNESFYFLVLNPSDMLSSSVSLTGLVNSRTPEN